jgi:hypothetical protein
MLVRIPAIHMYASVTVFDCQPDLSFLVKAHPQLNAFGPIISILRHIRNPNTDKRVKSVR